MTTVKIGTIIKNKYQIEKLLGQGATAQVFLAKDLEFDEYRALKIQQDQFGNQQISNLERRFSLEAKTLQQFDNKNIVKVYDFFSFENRKVIVMEYVKGKPLDQVLKEKRKIPCKKTAFYALQILNALVDMHKKEIYHRDLKPSNIMLTFDDQIKLMDFGVIQVSINQDLTKQGSIIGTIDYVAPEIIKHQKVSKSSEIWALGVILYKMVTGMLPFMGSDIVAKARDIVHKEPIIPSELNPDVDKHFEQIIMKMLKKDYYYRYRSAESAIDAIMEYINKPKRVRNLLDNEKKPITILNTEKIRLLFLLVGIGIISGVIAIILIVFL